MISHIKEEGKYLISVNSVCKTLVLVGGEISVEELSNIALEYRGYNFVYKNPENNGIQTFEAIPKLDLLKLDDKDIKRTFVEPYMKWQTTDTITFQAE